MNPADLAEKSAELAEVQFETARSAFHLRNLRATGMFFIELFFVRTKRIAK